MRLCALCDVGFDMNLGKISAKRVAENVFSIIHRIETTGINASDFSVMAIRVLLETTDQNHVFIHNPTRQSNLLPITRPHKVEDTFTLKVG
jgi:hypothetical protein